MSMTKSDYEQYLTDYGMYLDTITDDPYFEDSDYLNWLESNQLGLDYASLTKAPKG